MGLFKREAAPDDAAAADATPPEQEESAPARKAKAATGPVTLEALSRKLDALQKRHDALLRIVALALVEAEEAGRYPGVCGGPGSPHLRLKKDAAAPEHFQLDSLHVHELRALLRHEEQARDGVRQREKAEELARDNLRRNPWLPDGSYGRRIV